MKRGPVPGRYATDFLAKAVAAWGDDPPLEVVALAEAAQRDTASAAARAIGYSPAVVSHVLANRYPGDLSAVFAKIRGVWLGEMVVCPVLGEIGRDQCLREQKRPFAATNSSRARLFHACKICPNRGSGEPTS
jgi:hypothetical protein